MARPSPDHTDRFHEKGIHIPTRTIYIGSEESHIEHGESGVDAAMAERAIKNLRTLEMMGTDPITILLECYGGDVNHGLAIYSAIKSCVSEVTIITNGGVMSMGSVIMQAGDERLMRPEATQMIHYGQIGLHKESYTVYQIIDEMKRIDRWMEQIYLEKIHAKHPKFTLGRLRNMLRNDKFFTAEQSVEIGLADRVLEYPSAS